MVTLVVPTCNAGPAFKYFLEGLSCQLFKPDLVLLDSESSDSTVAMAREAGFSVHSIPRREFNHGGTRQKGVDLCAADIIVFMTQDAILATPEAIKNLLRCFEDERVGAACGRQLPCPESSPIAAHARLFNYPSLSSVKSQEDIKNIGIKAAFLSNSFAAYRRSALLDVGGFPSDVIFGEDTYVAAKMLQADWKIAYCAEATCYHSHNYSIFEEFRRYFDIGVFHSREAWFINSLGKPEGEGKKFVISEWKYMLKYAPWLIPSASIRTVLKLLGYKLGLNESYVPLWVKRHISLNSRYWHHGGFSCQ
jgi:rhamnosyltransferase